MACEVNIAIHYCVWCMYHLMTMLASPTIAMPQHNLTIEHYSLDIFFQSWQWLDTTISSSSCCLGTMSPTTCGAILLHVWFHIKPCSKSCQMCIICWRYCTRRKSTKFCILRNMLSSIKTNMMQYR